MALEDLNHPEENSYVDELRSRLKGFMNQDMYEDDYLFRRFLRARNHNIDAAELMLRNHLTWRKVNEVDTILTNYTPPEILASKYFPLNILGHNLDGTVVGYINFGCLDTRGLLKVVNESEIKTDVIKFIEENVKVLKEQNEKSGKRADGWVYVFNFENFPLATATHKRTLEVLGSIASMYDTNYPEMLKVAYFINASYYFTIGWAVVKNFLSPRTVQKVKIFGKVGWQEELLKHVNPDLLPAYIGGNLTDSDGDPMCRSLIRLGGKVPESLYKWENQGGSTRIPGSKKLVVDRMSKSEVPFHVLFPDSHIEWEFSVNSKDIGFSLLFRKNNNLNSKATVIIPHQRIKTSTSAETGMFLCKEAGIYVLEFDNTYSWIRNKEVYYKAAVVTSSKQNAGV